MASPFPGMDPYLESPQMWRGVHSRLINAIDQAINAQLPPGYASDIDERLYVERPGSGSGDIIYPDITVARPRPPVVPLQTAFAGSAAGTATLEAIPATLPETLTARPPTISEGFIQIFRVGQPGEVITIIEVLSPSNKAPGSAGRVSYVTKQEETLQSNTNLLEIDLLRQGAHTVAPPSEGLQRYGGWNYLISLHRPAQRYNFEFWRVSLRTGLPTIRVPLATEDPDLLIDLQAAFSRMYDMGSYARRIDYAQSPGIPLEGEDSLWADALLREKGLRP